MPLVSVITPCYNSEKYIQQTIDSFKNQSFRDCEFIFVNDGSNDSTVDILKANKSIDGRIKIVSITNHGISYARNIGIDNASGNYILFCDSDDILYPDAIESMVSAIESHKCDIVVGNYITFDKEITFTKQKNSKPERVDKNQMLSMLAKCTTIENFLWGKLFNSQIFRSFRFNPNYRIWEDVREMFKVISLCNDGVILNKNVVLYRQSSGTLSKKLGPEEINQFCIAQVEKANFYLTNYPKIAHFNCESFFQCASLVLSKNMECDIPYYQEFLSVYKRIKKGAGLSDKFKYFIINHKRLYKALFRQK